MARVACWVSNAYPGLRVGTAVAVLDMPEHGPNDQTQVHVETAEGRQFTVQRVSLVPMLPEEIVSGSALGLPLDEEA